MNYRLLLNELEVLLKSEHIEGCDQNTCDINKAYEHGFSKWAISLFSSTGATSDDFDELYNQLPKKFNQDAEKEREEFVESVSHEKCESCNSVIWDPEECDYFCESCSHDNSLYFFVIDLNERGVFKASVRDSTQQKVILSLSNEDDENFDFADYGMKNNSDVNGLEDHLKGNSLIPNHVSLKLVG